MTPITFPPSNLFHNSPQITTTIKNKIKNSEEQPTQTLNENEAKCNYYRYFLHYLGQLLSSCKIDTVPRKRKAKS